ncbi:hypothetical protein ACVQXT_004214 [Escherichia coli]|uniref:hypothetical protein n=1 Tax=Escherichia coli TaxID=562 RepID=UPI0016BA6034|nr:hypothetical protein [Escherichia coli]EFJ8922688.1 hypothetical protein [Escherichia coli]MDX5601691.1 hypothetical protein [Escherichia coli]HCN3550894.1 hypothetical protein [Escherichia coli]
MSNSSDSDQTVQAVRLRLSSQSARCISELKASALLRLRYELAIHGTPQNNHAQAWERVDTDYQRLKKRIWPEGDS